MQKLMRTLCRGALVTGLLVPTFGPVAMAQRDYDRNHGYGHDHGAWHGNRDIHHFRDHDFATWRGGHWFHGPHDGRNGWWWLANGGWYFYPAPIYPYPDPYTPPVVAVPAAPGQSWYYCPPAQGYYPYVTQCPVPWQPVPAR